MSIMQLIGSFSDLVRGAPAAAHAGVFDGSKWISGRLAFWDVTWSGAVAYDPSVPAGTGGTAYASMTDSSSAIAAAITKAKSIGVPVRGAGRFRVDNTVTIDCAADLSGAEFVSNDDALTTVRIGTSSSGQRAVRLSVIAPKVINLAHVVGSGWSGSSVGVEIANIDSSDIWVPYVYGCVVGLLHTAYGTGSSYNKVHIGDLRNCKVTQKLHPNAADAYVSENNYFGGQFTHVPEEGSVVSGVRKVLIGGQATGFSLDNNRWYGASFEGNVPEYHVEVQHGTDNLFLWCRWEVTSPGVPKIYWNQVSATEFAQRNRVLGGVGSERIAQTHSANAHRNRISSNYADLWESAATTEQMMSLANRSDDDRIIGLFDGSGGVLRRSLAQRVAEWMVLIGANGIKFKSASDTEAVLKITAANGRLLWGPGGSTAGDTELRRRGVGLLGTSDGTTFQAAEGTYNGGHLQLGSSHLWVDASGRLRIKSSAPTSDTDGTIVGAQS